HARLFSLTLLFEPGATFGRSPLSFAEKRIVKSSRRTRQPLFEMIDSCLNAMRRHIGGDGLTRELKSSWVVSHYSAIVAHLINGADPFIVNRPVERQSQRAVVPICANQFRRLVSERIGHLPFIDDGVVNLVKALPSQVQPPAALQKVL